MGLFTGLDIVNTVENGMEDNCVNVCHVDKIESPSEETLPCVARGEITGSEHQNQTIQANVYKFQVSSVECPEPIVAQINAALFDFPKFDPTPVDCVDERDDLEILQDCCDFIRQKLDEDEVKYYSKVCKRDITELEHDKYIYTNRAWMKSAMNAYKKEREHILSDEDKQRLDRAEQTITHSDRTEHGRLRDHIIKEQQLAKWRDKGDGLADGVREAEINAVAVESRKTVEITLKDPAGLPFLSGAIGAPDINKYCLHCGLLADTGASMNAISVESMRKMKYPVHLLKCNNNYILHTASERGCRDAVLGEAMLTVRLQDKRGWHFVYTDVWLVLSGPLQNPIIGIAAFRRMEATIYTSLKEHRNSIEMNITNVRSGEIERVNFALRSRDHIEAVTTVNDDAIKLEQDEEGVVNTIIAVEQFCSQIKVESVGPDLAITNPIVKLPTGPLQKWNQDMAVYQVQIPVRAVRRVAVKPGERSVRASGLMCGQTTAADGAESRRDGAACQDQTAGMHPDTARLLTAEGAELPEEGFDHWLESGHQAPDGSDYKMICSAIGTFREDEDKYVGTPRDLDKVRTAQLDHLSKNDQKQVREIIDKYPDIQAKTRYETGDFDGYEISIPTVPGKQAMDRPRRYSDEQLKVGDKNVATLEQEGIIEPADISEWRHCLHFVEKPPSSEHQGVKIVERSRADKALRRYRKDTGSTTDRWRTVDDVRNLNKLVSPKPGRISLPSTEEMRLKLHGKKVVKLDLSQGYYCLKIRKGDRMKTTFYWRNKLWQFKRMLQGLVLSPYYFQQLLEFVVSRKTTDEFMKQHPHYVAFNYDEFVQNLIIYSDDLLLMADSWELALMYLDCLLFCLNRHKMKINISKCSWFEPSFEFLGHVYRMSDISAYSQMSTSRIASFIAWRSPRRSLAEISSRAALCSFYQRYIPLLKYFTAPFHRKLSGADPAVWTLRDEKMFNNLRFIISLGVRNYIPDPAKCKLLVVDSSWAAHSSAMFDIMPTEPGKDQVEYLRLTDCNSRLHTKTKIQLPILEKEEIGFGRALKYHEPAIRASIGDVIVCLDASVITLILRGKDNNGLFMGTSIFLTTLDNVVVLSWPGAVNTLADALGRAYLHNNIRRGAVLSKEMSQVIPVNTFPDMAKLSNEFIKKLLQSSPEREKLDCAPRLVQRNDCRTPKDLVEYLNEKTSTEEQAMLAAVRGLDYIQLPSKIWNKMILQGKVSEKLKVTPVKVRDFVKKHQLGMIKTALEKLPETYGNLEEKIVAEINFMDVRLHRVEAEESETEVEESFCGLKYKNQVVDLIHQVEQLARADGNDELARAVGEVKKYKSRAVRTKALKSIENIMYDVYRIDEASHESVEDGVFVQFVPVFQAEESEIEVTGDVNKITLRARDQFTVEANTMKEIRVNIVIFNKQALDPQFEFCIDGKRNCSRASAVFGLISAEIRILAIYAVAELIVQPGQALLEISGLTKQFGGGNSEVQQVPVFVSKKSAFLDDPRSANDVFNRISDLECLVEITQAAVELSEEQPDSNGEKQVDDNSEEQDVEDAVLVRDNIVDPQTGVVRADPDIQQVGTYPKSVGQRRSLNKMILLSQMLQSGALLDTKSIREFQRSEQWLVDVESRLQDCRETAEPGVAGTFVLRDEMIQRRISRMGVELFVICIPAWLMEALADGFHRSLNNHMKTNIVSPHYPSTTLYDLLSSMFYCPKMYELINRVVSGCMQCVVNKKVRHRKYHHDNRHLVSKKNNAWVQCDLLENLPASSQGHKACLVMTDTLTKIVYLKAIKGTPTSAKVLQALQDIWQITDLPLYFSSDHSSLFRGKVSEFLALHNVKHYKLLPRNSKAAGEIEGRVRLVREYLNRLLVGVDKKVRRLWNHKLFYIQLYINRTLTRDSQLFSRYSLDDKSRYNAFSGDFADDVDMTELKEKYYSERLQKKEAGLHNKSNIPVVDIRPGSFVKFEIEKNQQKVLNKESRAIQPTTPGIYQVISINEELARVINMTNGFTEHLDVRHLSKATLPEVLHLPDHVTGELLSDWKRSKKTKRYQAPLYKFIENTGEWEMEQLGQEEPETVDAEESSEESAEEEEPVNDDGSGSDEFLTAPEDSDDDAEPVRRSGRERKVKRDKDFHYYSTEVHFNPLVETQTLTKKGYVSNIEQMRKADRIKQARVSTLSLNLLEINGLVWNSGVGSDLSSEEMSLIYNE